MGLFSSSKSKSTVITNTLAPSSNEFEGVASPQITALESSVSSQITSLQGGLSGVTALNSEVQTGGVSYFVGEGGYLSISVGEGATGAFGTGETIASDVSGTGESGADVLNAISGLTNSEKKALKKAALILAGVGISIFIYKKGFKK